MSKNHNNRNQYKDYKKTEKIDNKNQSEQTAQGIEGEDVSIDIDLDAPKDSYEDALQVQLDLERKNADTFKRMAIQLQADFDNYRKRNLQATENARQDGVAEAVKALLPAYDAVLSALKLVDDPKVREGLEMVEREYIQALKSLNIEVIPTLGEAFDPSIHNAIMTEETEGIDSGTVLEEIQRGFRGPNGVVRYAIVKIAK